MLAGLLCVGAGCAGSPAVRPAAPTEVVPLPPLAEETRSCQDTLPLGTRTVAALHQLLTRINPALTLTQRDCRAGDAFPIAYATSEAPESGKPPVGFEILRMTGDALLTFDDKNRESPSVNLCRRLDYVLDPAHVVRAVALWDSSDERALDEAHLERSTAHLAWLELLSRTPSDCALGKDEAPLRVGEAALAAATECALTPLVLATVPRCQLAPPRAAPEGPTALVVEAAATARHRVHGVGRSAIEPPEGLPLSLERPEMCFYEPPPATRDLCLAEYTLPGGERWYGRGDVHRTGEGGVKNFVDSYLTFIVLKRLEAGRRGDRRPAPDGGARKK